MISLENINKIKNNGWWCDTPSEEYVSAIKELGIDPNTTIGQFYIHAEDGHIHQQRSRFIPHLLFFAILNI